MRKPIQSAGGIIYYIDKKDNQPRFLMIKRYALSKRIEWVAPKGKVDPGETPEITAIREIHEEAGLNTQDLKLIEKVGVLSLSLQSEEKGNLDKDIEYYLVKHNGSPDNVKIDHVEGYIGVHGWFKIEEVLGLIYYGNFRELFRKAYNMVKEKENI